MALRFTLFLIILLNLTDNVLGAWLHRTMATSQIAMQVVYAKYLILGILFLGFVIDMAYGARVKRHEWAGMLYLGIAVVLGVLISVFQSEYGATGRLYLYVFPVIIYFAGAFVGRRSEFGVAHLVKVGVTSYLIMAGIFLVLNVVIGAVELWRDHLDYARFVLDAKGSTDAVIDGLKGNFYFTFAGRLVPRFLGSLGDPLALAYSGAIFLVAAYFVFPAYRVVVCGALVLILAASVTRAVFLGVPAAALIYWKYRERGFDMALLVAVFGVAMLAFVGEAVFSLTGDSSTAAHVLSVSDIFGFLDPATLAAGTLGGGKLPEFEPGFLNVLFLFGLGPFVLFLTFIRGIYRESARPDSMTPYVAIIMIMAVLTLSVISSVFFATTSSWFAWFLAGFASRRSITRVLPDMTQTPAALPNGQLALA